MCNYVFYFRQANLQEIYDFARHVCLYPRVEDAFLCMDVTYFSVLLREFFDLKTTDPIEVSFPRFGFSTNARLGILN